MLQDLVLVIGGNRNVIGGRSSVHVGKVTTTEGAPPVMVIGKNEYQPPAPEIPVHMQADYEEAIPET